MSLVTSSAISVASMPWVTLTVFNPSEVLTSTGVEVSAFVFGKFALDDFSAHARISSGTLLRGTGFASARGADDDFLCFAHVYTVTCDALATTMNSAQPD